MIQALLGGFDALLATVYSTLVGMFIIAGFVMFLILLYLAKRLDNERTARVDYERSPSTTNK